MRLALAMLVLLSCGGLDNRPLRSGTVTGHVADCDGTGVVGIVGEPELRAVPDTECNFRLDDVEVGPHEVYVSPSNKRAALVQVEVQAAKVSELGEVATKPGSFVRINVTRSGGPVEGSVTAPELPIAETPIGTRIGPFPQGCFRLEVSIQGTAKKAVSSCLAEGEEKGVELAL